MCAVCGDKDCRAIADTVEVTLDVPTELMALVKEWSKRDGVAVHNMLNMALVSALTTAAEDDQNRVFAEMLPTLVSTVYIQ